MTLDSSAHLDPAAGGAPRPKTADPETCFQRLILRLQDYWARQGCVLLQPYDLEVGAGTFHPATTLRALGPGTWNAAYVQPSRRPTDGRYGENPNRLQHYYQFQVLMKPAPDDSPGALLGLPGGDRHRPAGARHPLRRGRLGEPDPGRLGARLGGLVRRHGGHPVHLFSAGRRHRLQSGLNGADLRFGAPGHVRAGVENVYDLDWDGLPIEQGGKSYGDVFLQAEREFSAYNFEHATTERLVRHFQDVAEECHHLLNQEPPPLPAGLRPVHEGQPYLQSAWTPAALSR